MAKTFYSYEKRQKELAKLKKKEEKRLLKLERKQQKENPEAVESSELQGTLRVQKRLHKTLRAQNNDCTVCI